MPQAPTISIHFISGTWADMPACVGASFYPPGVLEVEQKMLKTKHEPRKYPKPED